MIGYLVPMLASVGSLLLVVAGSMLKFALGPLLGYGLHLAPVTTATLSALGMMLTTILITFMGERLHMAWSSVLWAIVYTTIVYRAGHFFGLTTSD